MKFLETKINEDREIKNEKREKYANDIFDEISSRLECEKTVEILLNRDDFKSEMSVDYGFGWQDLKEKNKILAQKLMLNYDIKFLPVDIYNMEIKVVIKNK